MKTHIGVKIAFVHPALMDYRLELFNELHTNYNINFILTRQGRGQDDIKEKHLKIPNEWKYNIVQSDKLEIRRRSIVMYINLIRELSKIEHKIILTSTSWYICFLIAKITGKKFIFLTEFWFFPSISYIDKIKNYYTKYMLRHSSAVIVTGSKSYEQMLDFGINIKKIFKCIQSGIDYSKMPVVDIRRDLGLKDEIIILYFSRIIRSKGLDYLIKAFSLLKMDNKAILLIVGDGPFKIDCEKLVGQLGTQNIFFVGYSEDRASYFQACDVFVLPAIFIGSKYEPWGMVINEAMAFGKPIISTDAVGSAYDLVKNNENGFVVKNKDINELYMALHTIISNPLLKESMGKNSRKIFEDRNNHKQMFKAFEDAINYVDQTN